MKKVTSWTPMLPLTQTSQRYCPLKVDKLNPWCRSSGDKSTRLCLVACWDRWDWRASEQSESLIAALRVKT